MTQPIGDGRPLRVCDLCGGVDDHPRHTVAGVTTDRFPAPEDHIISRVADNSPPEHQARLLRDLLDTGSTERHLDCCREAGCPEGTCDVTTAGAEDLRGVDLLAHLMSRAQNGD